jgi:hypothetical protein
MALLLEVLQKSDKTYAIDRGFLGFFLKKISAISAISAGHKYKIKQ